MTEAGKMAQVKRLKELANVKKAREKYQSLTDQAKRYVMAAGLLLALMFVYAMWCSVEPAQININTVVRDAKKRLKVKDEVTGFTFAATLNHLINKGLVNKPQGYISNDVMPPTVFLDNITGWEYGVLAIARRTVLSLREDLSRSRTSSVEEVNIVDASTRWHIDSTSWLFPSPESQYSKGARSLDKYLRKLTKKHKGGGQFYARADNLARVFEVYSQLMGSMSQRLDASRGRFRINTDLAGDKNAVQSTKASRRLNVKTNFWKTDDVFYEARGQAWALLGLLKAIQVDFESVLKDKNAERSLQLIIDSLEGTQQGAPFVVWNARGFGFFPNHSFVMNHYLSRAQAGMLELAQLLKRG